MAEAQEKRPTQDDGWNLGDRLTAALGREARNCGYPFSSWTLPFEDLRALLDKLDEAKAERDEARADVGRLRSAIAHADANARDWQSAESEAQKEVRKRDARIANLEDEVERLTKERSQAQRTAVDEAQDANKATGRVEELEVEVARLRGEVFAASDSMRKVADLNEWLCGQRTAQPVSVGLAGLHTCDAVRMEIEALDARLAWFEGEPIDSRSRAGRLELLERVDKAQGDMIAREVARRDKAECRVGELEAEVERLRQAVNDFLGDIGMLQEADGIDREFLTDPDKIRDRLSEVARRWKHDEDMGGQAVERLADLEEAIRREWANHRKADPAERGDCMDRLLGLVEPDDADSEESGDQRPCFDTLDDVALAMSGVLDRLARLEAGNG